MWRALLQLLDTAAVDPVAQALNKAMYRHLWHTLHALELIGMAIGITLLSAALSRVFPPQPKVLCVSALAPVAAWGGALWMWSSDRLAGGDAHIDAHFERPPVMPPPPGKLLRLPGSLMGPCMYC